MCCCEAWRGAWSAATAYFPYDLVSYAGGTYISIASKTATQAKQAINDLNLTGVSAM